MTAPWYKSEEYAKYHQKGIQATLVNGKITAEVMVFYGIIRLKLKSSIQRLLEENL